jgi:hypothetical protein
MAHIWFAVPRATGIKTVGFNCAFHVDDIDVPPDVSWGEITFPLHSIVWLVYSTKAMVDWPASSHFCHYDGYAVPLFMGGGPKAWKFVACLPRYTLKDAKLEIELQAAPPEAADASA